MFSIRSAVLLLPASIALIAAAGGGSDGGEFQNSTGQGGSTATTGTGPGGGTTSGTTSGTNAGGGTGTGGAPGCQGDADCANDPNGTVCDLQTGLCVGCLVGNDQCPSGQFCNPATDQCEVGCTDDTDCDPGAGLLCNTQTHKCVGCVLDTDCPQGSICVQDTCVPGCSGSQPCQPGFTCCGQICFDISSDEGHCGTCNTICPVPPQAQALCQNGQCLMGPCDGAYADCNGNAADGCEWNTLQDGPCVCSPGQQQSCYQGAPGTQNVGPCKAGVQTCDATGTSWGPCVGQVLPASEVCANNIDEDCDGLIDNGGDADGDGWTICNGDCCDAASPNCASPKLVNPGAFEVVGNGVDDDCDGSTSDVVAPAACSSNEKFTGVTSDDVAKAIDLCQFTTANPPLPTKKWGVIQTSLLLANGTVPNATQLANMQNFQAAVLVNYGTGGVVPQKGPTMAGLSSGRMRDQSDVGYVAPNGGSSMASNSQPPAAYLAAHANALPSSAGCSGNCPAGSGANDSVNVRMSIRVPTNAQSFSYQFRFFSAEYWTYSCTSFNDFYLALLQTTAPGIPADKNISFDGVGNPVSVNNGFFDVCAPKGCYTCPAGTAALQGTGMQVSNTGGATNWLTTDAPIMPGETMQLELMIFDVSDNILDSLSILDNFHWNLAPSAVGTHE